MKLIRHGASGQEKPGLIDADGRYRDLSSVLADIGPEQLSEAALQALRDIDPAGLPQVPVDTRLGPPVVPRKVVCIGLNYVDHAKESGLPIPAEPVLFMKADTSVCGPNDDIPLPPEAHKLDWEVELGIVIGSTARRVSEADALAHVAGYTVVDDLSERAWQTEGTGQWVKGKAHDHFCPFGPALTTRDEIPDPQVLDLYLDIDGQRVQSGNTATMIFDVAHIVSYLSYHMTLRAGDLISTGTPPGVGMGMKPPRYLKLGETIELGIAGLGSIRHRIVEFDA